MSRSLIEYLPPILKEIKDFQEITSAIDPEFVDVEKAASKVLDDQFIATATEFGIKCLEEMIGIMPKATETLEERRFTLATLFLEKRPTTFNFLKMQLELLCGKDGYTLFCDYENYLLVVRLALAAKSNYTAVENLITQIKPANIVLDLDLLYNRYSKYKGNTHSELSAYQHETLRSEVI